MDEGTKRKRGRVEEEEKEKKLELTKEKSRGKPNARSDKRYGNLSQVDEIFSCKQESIEGISGLYEERGREEGKRAVAKAGKTASLR